jgi:NTE family protein
MPSFPARNPETELALVLSGGNALGAYHGGAYQALHEAGWLPDRVVGASAGAVSGAVICGNAAEQRMTRLEALWRPSPGAGGEPEAGPAEELRRTNAVAYSMAMGQPGIFAPRSIYGPWWNPFGNTEPASLYDATPLDRTLSQLVDFDRLNAGAPRFSLTAVDVESGEDILFDTTTHALGADHVRASSALLPAFSPVEIGGRMLADAGLSLNLPLDTVLSEASERPLLCIAVDLLPLRGPRPTTLGEAIVRMQDIVFAAQSRLWRIPGAIMGLLGRSILDQMLAAGMLPRQFGFAVAVIVLAGIAVHPVERVSRRVGLALIHVLRLLQSTRLGRRAHNAAVAIAVHLASRLRDAKGNGAPAVTKMGDQIIGKFLRVSFIYVSRRHPPIFRVPPRLRGGVITANLRRRGGRSPWLSSRRTVEL